MDTRNQNIERLVSAVKIIDRNTLDDARWNALVDRTPDASFFSYTWYLDATAENWCALIDEEYNFGLALPYSVRLGVETLYTPIFVRYIELLGNGAMKPSIKALVFERFKNMNISVKQDLFGSDHTTFEYQAIQSNAERKLNSQAKRMVNKAVKNDIAITTTDNFMRVFKIIQKELSGKHDGLDDDSMMSLLKLFEAGGSAGVIQVYEIENNGGIACFENDRQTLYLKGTTTVETKSNGGMYALLNESVTKALEGHRKFDFGGSRVEGVSRFNKNLGGTDVHYFNYKVDKTPFWFKFARRIKHAWKK
ncbi:MAG: hypothetical protein QNK23_12725 [Crocinitomicaceae bacterium]|nr:hypothetical protein [Crocinitomicaceae bacterium]